MAENRPDVPWWQRLVQRVASSRPVSWLFSYTLHYVDRVLLRLSGGRISIPELFAGVPVVRLRTTGARSGEERTVPVLGLQDGESWIVIASNWGSERHPAWYYNLKAHPEVGLTVDDETAPYVARDATEDERETYWDMAVETYMGFEPYRRRSGDREIPVVVLEPAEAADGTNA